MLRRKDHGSGDLTAPENIRPQFVASHLVPPNPGDVLNSGPPFRVEQDLVGQPIRNGLLANGRTFEELRDAFRKCDLTTSDINRAAKRGNVTLLHKARAYTNAFVAVNNPVCVTGHKEACIVLDMTVAKKKQTARKSTRLAKPGPDGKTLGQRVAEAMAYEAGRRGQEYRQADLVVDVAVLADIPESEREGLQQSISAIMVGKVTRSSFTAYIAAACHISATWLSSGKGKMIA